MKKSLTKSKKHAKLSKIDREQIPIVQVTWSDASSYMGWTSNENYEEILNKDLIVETVGFLYRKCSKYIAVVQTMNGGVRHGGLGNVMRIPSKMLVNTKILGYAKVKGFKI